MIEQGSPAIEAAAMTEKPSLSMSIPSPSAVERNLPQEVMQVLGLARRVQTRCGQGHIVWHCWGQEGARHDRAPLVLLHGGSGSWTHWLRNIPALIDSGRSVLVPDLPGFGDSDLPPGGKDADAMPEPLERGLCELIGDRACDGVGFSFGGMVAGLWARVFAARFSRLVLVAPPGLGRPALQRIRPKAWRHLASSEQRLLAHTHNLREIMLYHEASTSALACQLQQINAERDRLPSRRLSRTDVLRAALVQVSCPVDVLYGQHDRYYLGQTADIETILRTCPGFGRMQAIAGAGHWVQFEQPQAFNYALLGLLNDGAVDPGHAGKYQSCRSIGT